MFKRAVSFLVLLSCLCFVSACRRTDYPEGFPKIHPVKIKVVEGGTPLEGVKITVAYDNEQTRKWGTTGFTGADGVANLSTRGFSGAPEGSAILLLEKRDPPIKQNPDGTLSAGNTENQIDDRFSDLDESPFKATIAKKQKGLTVIDLDAETVSAE